MIAAFTAYMESLPDYAEQVRYYIRISKAMALNPLMGGSTLLHDGICWSGYGEGKPVDKQGNALNSISWGMPTGSVGDKSMRHRIYFTEFYKDRYESIWDFKISTKSELTTNYLQRVATSLNPEAFKNSELKTVVRTIEKYQSKILQWANELKVSLPIREQFIQASQLVEDELNGSDAIDWSLFYSPSHLNPFALLWDITDYKLFLELPVGVHENQQAKISGIAYSKNAAQAALQSSLLRTGDPVGFDTYIKENYRKELMAYLIDRYHDQKPKEIVPMLYALEMLGVISGKVTEHDQTSLHNALTVTFGAVGTRTALNTSLRAYWLNPLRPDPNRRRQIEMHKKPIADLLRGIEYD